MNAVKLLPNPTPADAGLTCRACGCTTFKTRWQTFANGTKHVRQECGDCGAFARFLPQHDDGKPAFRHEAKPADAHAAELRPPPASWKWIGYVRPADGKWYAVALADSLGKCWDCLLTTHMVGDRLCVPAEPSKPKADANHETEKQP